MESSNQRKMEMFRSKTRLMVTYILVTSFSIISLLICGNTDNALALLSGFSGVASATFGFGFESRGVSVYKAAPDAVDESITANGTNFIKLLSVERILN